MSARITVAVPCYKQDVFLFECLNSLVAQSITDWEAFVVDDCSPGNMIAQIVASYDDSRIRYLRHEQNRGASASRNTAMRASRAPMVVYLDSDDFLHPDFLLSTTTALEESGADCVFTDFQLVGLSNVQWKSEVKTADDLAITQWIPGPGTVMRITVWERIGGYWESRDINPNEDWDFWIAALSLRFSFINIPRPLYFYRRHENSMTASHLACTEWKTRELIIKRHPEFFSIGHRAKVFRTGGLLRSARACRDAGYRPVSYLLTIRAAKSDPTLIFSKTFPAAKFVLRRGLKWLWRKLAGTIVALGQFVRKLSNTDERRAGVICTGNPQRDWDSLAVDLHNRYGHLSHDYPLLMKIIEQTGTRSVLEIGCGSGRLIPVYLIQNLNPIIAHDVSNRALEICKQRFFCQKNIRYVQSDIDEIPGLPAVDLVVSTRVLQHIDDHADVRRAISNLAPKTRAFFVNEITSTEASLHKDPSVHAHDYDRTFAEFGFHIASQGQLEAESGTRQKWKLFEKTK